MAAAVQGHPASPVTPALVFLEPCAGWWGADEIPTQDTAHITCFRRKPLDFGEAKAPCGHLLLPAEELEIKLK